MSWKFDHDPEARPLGCNGLYGTSGRAKHRYYDTKVCEDCLASARHYARERARGQKYPRVVKPCGTRAAADRHRYRKEPLCKPCMVAEANDRAEHRKLAA